MVATGVPQELPVRALAQLCEVIEHRIQVRVREELQAHESRRHSGCDYPTPPRTLPFADRNVPDPVLAKMTEALEEEPDCNEQVLALRYDLPLSLIQRELARYRSRVGTYIQHLALVPVMTPN